MPALNALSLVMLCDLCTYWRFLRDWIGGHHCSATLTFAMWFVMKMPKHCCCCCCGKPLTLDFQSTRRAAMVRCTAKGSYCPTRASKKGSEGVYRRFSEGLSGVLQRVVQREKGSQKSS